MLSRRHFLTTLAAGMAAPAVLRARLGWQEEIKTVLNGPVGVQMWSFREYLPKDRRRELSKPIPRYALQQ